MSNINFPSDWNEVELGNVLKRVRKPVHLDPGTMYREIGIRSHGKGIFYKDERFGISIGDKAVFWVEPDCFIVNIVFAWEQAVARTTANEKGMIASHRFPMYKPAHEELDLDYLVYFFNTPRGKHLLGLASPGGAGRNKTLGQNEFLKLVIPLPPYNQQRRIVEILNNWSKAIICTERIITALQARKRGFMQHLLLVEPGAFSPVDRLKGFSGKWNIKHLKDVFSRVTRKNGIGCENVLTASAQQGLMSQLEYYNKSVAGKNLSNYYLVKKGEFAYNRGRSTGYPFGAIKRLEDYDEGILSTLYICFRLKNEQRDSGEFYKHYFEAGILNRGLYQITQEGARNHGLLNISVSDFFDLPIPIPAKNEQNALAEVFNLVDQEITLEQAKLKALEKQKKGLMQKLLTGQVRVKV